MLIRAPNGTYEAIDFRETAPVAAFENMYLNNEQASLTSGLARLVGLAMSYHMLIIEAVYPES